MFSKKIFCLGLFCTTLVVFSASATHATEIVAGHVATEAENIEKKENERLHREVAELKRLNAEAAKNHEDHAEISRRLVEANKKLAEHEILAKKLEEANQKLASHDEKVKELAEAHVKLAAVAQKLEAQEAAAAKKVAEDAAKAKAKKGKANTAPAAIPPYNRSNKENSQNQRYSNRPDRPRKARSALDRRNETAKKEEKKGKRFKKGQGDLTLEDLKEAFQDFSFKQTGKEPDTKVHAVGLIYAECDEFFKFHKVKGTQFDSDACKSSVGFVVTDEDGEGRKCVEWMDKHHPGCDHVGDCVRLSERADAKYDLSKEGDVDFRIFSANPNKDEDHVECEKVGANEISHKTEATLAQMKKAEEEERIQKRVAKLTKDIPGCSLNDISNLRVENESLMRLKAITETAFSENEKKLAEKEEKMRVAALEEIAAKIAPASIGDLDTIREEILSWAGSSENENIKMGADFAAEALRRVMLKYKNQPNAGPEAWDQAAAVAREAMSLSGLKLTTIDILRKDIRDIAIGKLLAQGAQYGVNSPVFVRGWAALSSSEMEEFQNNCLGLAAPSQEACGPSLENYRRIVGIPAQVRETAAKKQQMLQELLHNAGQGQGNAGSPFMMEGPFSSMPGNGLSPFANAGFQQTPYPYSMYQNSSYMANPMSFMHPGMMHPGMMNGGFF